MLEREKVINGRRRSEAPDGVVAKWGYDWCQPGRKQRCAKAGSSAERLSHVDVAGWYRASWWWWKRSWLVGNESHDWRRGRVENHGFACSRGVGWSRVVGKRQTTLQTTWMSLNTAKTVYVVARTISAGALLPLHSAFEILHPERCAATSIPFERLNQTIPSFRPRRIYHERNDAALGIILCAARLAPTMRILPERACQSLTTYSTPHLPLTGFSRRSQL